MPDWVERLDKTSYTSPSGKIFFPKIDLITRVGGKKASLHEILNKNIAIPQDQGNRVRRYPCDFYFTGNNGDTESDNFFEALHEKYTIANPGILKLPNWGNIRVMPFSEPTQTHNLVNGAGIFRISVEFITVPLIKYPTAEGLNDSEVTSDITELENTLNEANKNIDIDEPSKRSAFNAKIRTVVAVVKDSLSSVANRVDDINDTFRSIQSDIDSALSAGVTALEIMSQVNNLIRLPSQIADSTISKVQLYSQMANGITNSFVGFFNPKSDRTVELNSAIMYQSFSSFASTCLSEAALFTDYNTRDMVMTSLDFINDSEILSLENSSLIYQLLTGNIETIFKPDHNTNLELLLITGKTNAILLERSFSLKAKKTIILSAPSDAITLTYKYYKSVSLSNIEFFIKTNNLNDNEIIETPSGREIIVYV